MRLKRYGGIPPSLSELSLIGTPAFFQQWGPEVNRLCVRNRPEISVFLVATKIDQRLAGVDTIGKQEVSPLYIAETFPSSLFKATI